MGLKPAQMKLERRYTIFQKLFVFGDEKTLEIIL